MYNMRSCGCMLMLTFILSVLGEALGIGNSYCMPFYLVGIGSCVRPRDRLPNIVLANFGHHLLLLIVEQTLQHFWAPTVFNHQFSVIKLSPHL